MSILVVTGTGTGVGKTIVTAAVASLARERGASVAVVKPAQTGVSDTESGDLDDVIRLSGVMTTFELSRFPDPLAPAAAARLSGCRRSPRPGGDPDQGARRVAPARDRRGVGRAARPLRRGGATVADLARMISAPVLLVAGAGSGTLNHTALTLEAMAHRGWSPPEW
ncbi:ATP-dependent dethiobiotin synthetase BioD [Streptosporangium lutulentum]